MKNSFKRTLLGVFAMAAPLSSAQALECERANDVVNEGTVVEVVTYKLREGLSEDDYLKAVEATFPFLCKTDGFVRRALSKGEDGTWVEFVEWTNLDAAKAASELAMSEPTLADFMSAADMETMTFNYYDIAYRID